MHSPRCRRRRSRDAVRQQGYAHARYEFPSPQGTAHHDKGAEVGPAHVVGEEYPMVLDPQNTKRPPGNEGGGPQERAHARGLRAQCEADGGPVLRGGRAGDGGRLVLAA